MPTMNPANLVFLDEAGSNAGMIPSYGYAPRGERAVDDAPKSRGTNVSILAAMTWDGPLGARTFEGAINGSRFLHWVRRVLAPKLWEGAVVVVDNVVRGEAPPSRTASPRACSPTAAMIVRAASGT